MGHWQKKKKKLPTYPDSFLPCNQTQKWGGRGGGLISLSRDTPNIHGKAMLVARTGAVFLPNDKHTEERTRGRRKFIEQMVKPGPYR